MEDGVRADIVEGLHALEENDLDTASNRFLQVLADHPKEVICADYMAWIEARKGNLDKALQYARASFAVDGHLASYELMGYLALCGRGKAVGAQAALYYFEAALRDVPDSQRESKLRSMLSYSLKLCQKRSDYLLIGDFIARGCRFLRGVGRTVPQKCAYFLAGGKAGRRSACLSAYSHDEMVRLRMRAQLQ